MKKKILIVGAGAAGIMASIFAKEKNPNAEVILCERNDRIGRKLRITGKGRCNLTNHMPLDEMMLSMFSSKSSTKFLFSALHFFSNQDVVRFFETLGVKTKVERGGRVFPESDKAEDVIKALTKKLNALGILLKLNCCVKKILSEEKKILGVLCENGETILCDGLILATGGKSYPLTGSKGDGFRFAQELGHRVEKIFPALVPLEAASDDKKICSALTGLTLKNVMASLYFDEKKIDEKFGEMLFAHFGVTGPIILSLSRWFGQKNFQKAKLLLNLKPALDEKILDNRLLRDFQQANNKNLKNALKNLLPSHLLEFIFFKAKINPEKFVYDVTKEERKKLVYVLQHFSIEIQGTRPIDEAIVTAGGVSLKEISSKTMQSKLFENLFFCGEVIDADALTGGFNLQIAFSTGALAGTSCAEMMK